MLRLLFLPVVAYIRLSRSYFHRSYSWALLFLLISLEFAPREDESTGWLLAKIILTIYCLLLSPLQVLFVQMLFPTPRRSESHKQDRWEQWGDIANTEVDIIAVHGLGSKRETAWRNQSEEKLWLRDFLPSDLNARVIAYYHNSHEPGWTVEGLGSDLLQAVQKIRSEPNDSRGNTARPILFLGYSFGGIIVKRSRCSREEIQPIFQSRGNGVRLSGNSSWGLVSRTHRQISKSVWTLVRLKYGEFTRSYRA
ncbi:hypothetical protein HDK90DRAFT_288577 [Phyllosticta capitalensis]|uniref:Uncharacterized protein n=1 Tax=Phyllosticta capitalensis TaxID=121624 RepID=A0ABR1YNJ9_9PEZI